MAERDKLADDQTRGDAVALSPRAKLQVLIDLTRMAEAEAAEAVWSQRHQDELAADPSLAHDPEWIAKIIEEAEALPAQPVSSPEDARESIEALNAEIAAAQREGRGVRPPQKVLRVDRRSGHVTGYVLRIDKTRPPMPWSRLPRVETRAGTVMRRPRKVRPRRVRVASSPRRSRAPDPESEPPLAASRRAGRR
jgi:hypothetical protein